MKSPDVIKKGLDDIFVIYRSPCSNFVSEALQRVTANIVKEALAYIQQLETKCHQLEREKDALLEIVRNEGDCQLCKYANPECDGDCAFCEQIEPCVCVGCTTKNNHWEWTGIKEDNQ